MTYHHKLLQNSVNKLRSSRIFDSSKRHHLSYDDVYALRMILDDVETDLSKYKIARVQHSRSEEFVAEAKKWAKDFIYDADRRANCSSGFRILQEKAVEDARIMRTLVIMAFGEE